MAAKGQRLETRFRPVEVTAHQHLCENVGSTLTSAASARTSKRRMHGSDVAREQFDGEYPTMTGQQAGSCLSRGLRSNNDLTESSKHRNNT